MYRIFDCVAGCRRDGGFRESRVAFENSGSKGVDRGYTHGAETYRPPRCGRNSVDVRRFSSERRTADKATSPCRIRKRVSFLDAQFGRSYGCVRRLAWSQDDGANLGALKETPGGIHRACPPRQPPAFTIPSGFSKPAFRTHSECARRAAADYRDGSAYRRTAVTRRPRR